MNEESLALEDFTTSQTKFLSAFELSEIVFPQQFTYVHGRRRSAGKTGKLCQLRSPTDSALTEDCTIEFSVEVEDARMLFGNKADLVFAYPNLPSPPTAFLHPEIAVEYFSRLKEKGLWQPCELQNFLSRAETIFRELVEECCRGEVYLPMGMHYQMQKTQANSGQLILRSSVTSAVEKHTLENPSLLGEYKPMFAAFTLENALDLPRAVAEMSWLYLREAKEQPTNVFPGNFLLQLFYNFQQQGEILFFPGNHLSSCCWEVVLQKAPEGTASLNSRSPHRFQGKGYAQMQHFLPQAHSLFPTLQALPLGTVARLSWAVCKQTEQFFILGIRLAPHPAPILFVPSMGSDQTTLTTLTTQITQLKPFFAERLAAYSCKHSSWYGWVFQRSPSLYERLCNPRAAWLVGLLKVLGSHLGYKVCYLIMKKRLHLAFKFIQNSEFMKTNHELKPELKPELKLHFKQDTESSVLNIQLSKTQVAISEATNFSRQVEFMETLVQRVFSVQEQYSNPLVGEPLTWAKIESCLRGGPGNVLHGACSLLRSELVAIERHLLALEEKQLEAAAVATDIEKVELEYLTPREIEKHIFLLGTNLSEAGRWREVLDFRICKRQVNYSKFNLPPYFSFPFCALNERKNLTMKSTTESMMEKETSEKEIFSEEPRDTVVY